MGDDFHRLPSSPRKRGSSGVSCAPRHHKSTTLDSLPAFAGTKGCGNDGMCAFAGMTNRHWVDKRRGGPAQGFKSTSVKLNEASGMVYTPVSFLLCAESNFSTTSGAHGASFQICSWASR